MRLKKRAQINSALRLRILLLVASGRTLYKFSNLLTRERKAVLWLAGTRYIPSPASDGPNGTTSSVICFGALSAMPAACQHRVSVRKVTEGSRARHINLALAPRKR